jgi:hypothetical protein
MDYVIFAENTLVPSGEARGTMAVHYLEKPVMLHAVVREDNGQVRTRTVCDQLTVSYPPEQVEQMPWESAHLRMRCPECAKATGYRAINDLTGEIIPGR